MKLVGDWISRDDGDLAPSFPADAFAAAIAAAHEHGAKVTAHCFGTDVLQGLLDAGIDCLEHGTGLQEQHLAQMVDQGVALVPTVLQTDKFPEFADAGREKFPDYAATMERLHARRRDTLMAAHEAGVALYVGSDGGGLGRHGHLAEEIRAMADLGLGAEYAIAAASWRGREWLGWNAGLGEGDPADFVVLDADPRADLATLARPACVVLRGAVVASRLRRAISGAGRGLADFRAESRAGPDPLTRSCDEAHDRLDRCVPHPGATAFTRHEFRGDTTDVAVKIRLKRLGKVRVPQYRIVVVDSRKKRDGKVIEEIGLYHPKEDPSYITVASERAQYWLGVGAQPSEAVAKLLKLTGDWQTYKGLPGTEGTLRTAEPKRDKLEVFNEALKEVAGDVQGLGDHQEGREQEVREEGRVRRHGRRDR